MLKSLNLKVPSGVPLVRTALLLNTGIPQSGSTRAWCQTRSPLWRRVLQRSQALAALSLASTPASTISQTDSFSLPPLLSFPPSPHRCDDDRNHCVRHMSVVACGSTTILPSPIAKVVCVPFVAFQSASRAKCRILTWLVGCESNQVDGTIPLDHACPCPQP